MHTGRLINIRSHLTCAYILEEDQIGQRQKREQKAGRAIRATYLGQQGGRLSEPLSRESG